MLLISGYAPQGAESKRQLWGEISQLIASFLGECVVMGNFNEVRDESKRLGSPLYPNPARNFNQFIDQADLVDIHLGGPRFTWSDRWGLKFSKLDHFLVFEDILRSFPHLIDLVLEKKIFQIITLVFFLEHRVVYGPSPFRLFHSWFELDGFDVVVRDSWSTVVDGMRQLAIRGVMIDGIWVDDPGRVKKEFQLFYQKLFSRNNGMCPTTDASIFSMLSEAQVHFLQTPFSHDEIKRAVWDCGSDKALGPDGFSFGFLKEYWDLISDDLVAFIQHFHSHCLIPKVCNASFFSVIPKV
uniref:Endonuclease/exonuclease/phosphatase domain-containing protein n=1 Tax=Lactuca sativa TaxID=4236 RepID=A0A9R1V2Y9_LACSA|nr:hypothetical protein LSAT_V11C700368880 [Lactuca sativa]